MTVLITDQGDGFDFEKCLVLDKSRFLYNHGRGIVMTKIFLDFQYLGAGNEVLVTIPSNTFNGHYRLYKPLNNILLYLQQVMQTGR